MPNPKNKKTISFLVPIEYKFKGAVIKEAIDTLLGAMYKKLTKEARDEIKASFEKEMEVLKW